MKNDKQLELKMYDISFNCINWSDLLPELIKLNLDLDTTRTPEGIYLRRDLTNLSLIRFLIINNIEAINFSK